MIDIGTNLLKKIGDWNMLGMVCSSPNMECYLIERKGEGNKERSIFRFFRRNESIEEVRNILSQIELRLKNQDFQYILNYREGFASSVNGVSYLCVRMDEAKMITPVERENELIGLGRCLCKAMNEWDEVTEYEIDIAPECIYINSHNQYKVDVINEKLINALSKNKKANYIYSAPEIYKGNPHAASSQIYSIGMMLYEMANDGRLPFLAKKKENSTSEEMKEALNKRLNGAKIEPPACVSDSVGRTILEACSFMPEDRPTSLLNFEWALEKSGFTNAELVMHKDKGTAKMAAPSKFEMPELPIKKIAIGAACLLVLLIGGNVIKSATKKIEVPDLKDMTYNQAKTAVLAAGLEFEDQEGQLANNVFVASQEPAANSKVKKKTKVTVQMYEVKRDVTIPEIAGLDEESAKNALTEAGLVCQVEYQFSDVAKGTVMSSAPEQNSVVKEGDTVNLVVSQGVEQIAVPKLIDAKKDELDKLVKDIGLDYIVEETYNDADEGTVIKQSVDEGTQVDKGTVITVTVSIGPEPTTEATTEKKAEPAKQETTQAPKKETTQAPKKKENKKKETTQAPKKKKKKSESWDFE